MKSTTVPLAVGLVVLSIGCEQRLPPGRRSRASWKCVPKLQLGNQGEVTERDSRLRLLLRPRSER